MPRVQNKRGTSAALASVNPTPLAGELVWDSTENAIKIGDGATAWTSLAYVTATPRSHTHMMASLSDVSIASAGNPAVPYDVALTYNYATSSWVAKAIGLVGVGSQPLGGWPAGSVGASLAGKASTTHKSTHATGGSDALTPADIGAAPAASPTFTGAATFANTGSVVPLTVTNTGTANSFVVNDESSDSTPFVISANGTVGIGAAATTTSRVLLGGDVSGTGTNFIILASPTAQSAVTTLYGCLTFPSVAADCALTNLFHYGAQQGTTIAGTIATQIGYWAHSGLTSATNNYGFRSDIASGTGRWNFFANGTAQNYFAGNVGIGASRTTPSSALDVNGVITVAATSGSAGSYAPSLTFSGDSNTGFGQVSGQSDSASIFTAGHDRLRVTSAGRVGISNTAPGVDLEIGSNTSTVRAISVRHSTVPAYISNSFDGTRALSTFSTNAYDSSAGSQAWSSLVNAAYGPAAVQLGSAAFGAGSHIAFFTATTNSASPTEHVRIDGDGNVGIGTTSPTALLDINGNTIRLRTARTPASASAAGNAGDICWDADFVYICTATNTWRKARLSADGQTFSSAVGVRTEANDGSYTTLTSDDIAFATSSQVNARLEADATQAYLRTEQSTPLLLGTGNVERVRIKSNGAVRFVPLSSDPASGEAGDVYYNSTSNKLRVYNGTSWIDLH